MNRYVGRITGGIGAAYAREDRQPPRAFRSSAYFWSHDPSGVRYVVFRKEP